MSPSTCVQNGPATFCVRSATTIPSSGSATEWSLPPRATRLADAQHHHEAAHDLACGAQEQPRGVRVGAVARPSHETRPEGERELVDGEHEAHHAAEVLPWIFVLNDEGGEGDHVADGE